MTIAVLFPGQGSQFPGMADAWTTDPDSRAVLARASDTLGRDVAAACRDEPLLATTEWAQPLLLACDVAAWSVLEADGVQVAAAAGHSLGEFAALVASGVLDFAEALHLVAERARAMQAAADENPGTMTALLCASDIGEEICSAAGAGDVLAVANENGPKQVVLSGSIPAIERAEELARSRKIRAIRLNVAGAFHSPLMQPAVERMRADLSTAELADGRFPVVANVSARIIGDPAAFRDLLARHVISPVRWERSMRALADAGVHTFVEAGPGDVLTKLCRRIVPEARAVAVGSPEAAAAVAASFAEEPA